MKTNVNKTNTGYKIQQLPKPAKGLDRVVAGIIDLALLFISVKMLHARFDLTPLLPELHPRISEATIMFALYLMFTVFPHTLFSQTMGKFFMKIKLVESDQYKRLGLFNCFFRDFLFRPLILPLPFLLNNKEGRSFHDKICGSVVVSAK